MTAEELKVFEERQAEMQRTREIFDLICTRLNLKYGEFFGFRDTRGFVVINIYNDQKNKTRILKVSDTAEVLIDTYKYYSVNQSLTKPNLLFFSELRDKPHNYTTTRQGVLDENFEILLPALYDTLRDINEERYLCSINNYLGILNDRFEVIIPLKFREIQYNKTLRIFKAREQINEEGHSIYRIFDPNGLLLATLNYGVVNFTASDSCYTVYDIDIAYDTYIDDSQIIGSQGLLDHNFNILIPPIYDLIFKGEKFIAVYEMRDAVTGHDYESEEAHYAECYYTLDGGKWGIFDHDNNLVIPFQYNWIEHTFSDALFLINPTGLMYYYQGEQEDGAWYVKHGLWGLINHKNEVIVAPIYKYKQSFTDKIVFFNKQDNDLAILDIEDTVTIHF